MTHELFLRRKWTFRTGGQQVVFVKRSNEHASHVFMKAFLWSLYLPDYPGLSVEIDAHDRYKPDVVSFGSDARPLFWGEAGQVSGTKIRSLARRHRETHFAIAKWATRAAPHLAIIERALEGLCRTAPFDLLIFPEDSAERFIDAEGEIRVSRDELEWVRL
jgi:hypothetical protein